MVFAFVILIGMVLGIAYGTVREAPWACAALVALFVWEVWKHYPS